MAWFMYYEGGQYIVASQQEPITDRAAQNVIADFDSKEDAEEWASKVEQTVIWRT